MPHGRRKHILVAILNAIGTWEEETGMEFNADMIAGMFMAMMSAGRPLTTFASLPDLPEGEKGMLIIEGDGMGSETVAMNFYDDFDEGLFGDF